MVALQFYGLGELRDEHAGLGMEAAQCFGKRQRGFFLAVDYEDAAQWTGNLFGPHAQFILVSVAGERIDGLDVRAHLVRFAEDVYLLGSMLTLP